MTRAIETAAPEQPWAEMERLAKAAIAVAQPDEDVWYTPEHFPSFEPDDAAFIAAANPATVLALIAAAGANTVGIGAADEPKPSDPAVVGELVEALRVIANASERSEALFGGKMSDVTRVFEQITRVSRAALAKYATQQGGERDYPAEFEAWWTGYKHRSRAPADYPIKKQIAFDAFYFAATQQPPVSTKGEENG